MKNKIILSIILLFTSSSILFAQFVTGDIRTNNEGAWNSAFLQVETDWEAYNSDSGLWTDVAAPSTITTRVFINYDIKIGSGSSSITIGTGGQIIIAPNASLRVENSGVLSNTTASKIIIKADATGVGQLLLYTGETAAATQEVYLIKNKWHLIGSPFVGTAVSAFTGNYLQKYNESDNTWLYNYEPGFPTTFTKGYGFSAWRDASATYTMSGTSTASDKTISLPFSGGVVANYGFTLLANPYTCGLKFTTAYDMTGLSASIAIWNQDDLNYNYYVGSNNYTIPIGAGFFVKANSTGQSFTMLASSRNYSNNSNPVKSSTEETISQLRLKVKNINNEYKDKILVSVASGVNKNYSPSFDFPKMFGSDEAPAFFIKTEDDVLLAVKGIDASETYSFNLQLRPNVETTYNLSADEFTFDSSTEVLIEDLFTSQILTVDLDLDYTFTSTASDSEDRFRLYITPSANGIDDLGLENKFNVFGSNYQLKILSVESDYTLMVYNLLGQKLIEQNKIQGNTSMDLSAYKQKIVIVSIQTTEGVISKKIQLR